VPDPQDLREVARQAATSHHVCEDGSGSIPLIAESKAAVQYLRAVRSHLASTATEHHAIQRARAWLLDNHYLIERQIRQLPRDLPQGFIQRLPRLADATSVKHTRIDALARILVVRAELMLEADLIQRFVIGYQEVANLKIGELWALPVVLRAAVIDCLIRALHRIGEGAGRPPRFAETRQDPELALPAEEIVVRAIRCLQVMAVIDWKSLFEATSSVERALRDDPERAYPKMDFETRDQYRRAVEELARGAARDETEVARAAVARAAVETDPRQRHVGYWLVDRGRDQLDRELGFRAFGMERLRRALRRHPTSWYLGAIAVATLAAWSVPAWYLRTVQAGPAEWLVGLALTALPASTLAITAVQWIVAQMLPPRAMPKLDLRRGVPDDARTIVVVPTLIGSTADVDLLVRRLEVHYLCNPEPGLEFALLTDFLDAAAASAPEDAEILRYLTDRIETLNRQHGDGQTGRFHAFHRERRWNPAEGCWMGWERKRGKLEEFNRLLRDATDTSYILHVGEPATLANIRFVITLDTDTHLPRGTAVRLVGVLAHPLHRAVVDPRNGRTVAGYTVVQPRVEIAPESGDRSTLTRLFAGDAGFDIYTRAVSDVYQDLFGEGIYVGKGIYEVDAFAASLEQRAPENALASHDLFEGAHGRAALATAVVLYEEFPAHYLGYARRLHRWVRGDWQLLPWLFRRVPARGERRLRNRLSTIDHWKIFDNLRRSLLTPALVLLLAAGWLWLPGDPATWTLAALLVPVAHAFTALVTGLARGARRAPIRPWLAGLGRSAREAGGRWFLAVVFLVHESVVVVDAIVRVLVRMTLSRRRLLEWTTAARTASMLETLGPRRAAWREMLPGVLIAAALAAAVVIIAPRAIPTAAPLLLLWILAPEIARTISEIDTGRPESIADDDRRRLRRLARRTWFFYETFAGPEDQWLPPDHFQEDPKGVVAHRTSPTNIAMHLLSTQAAFDLGYVGVSELVVRLGNTLETVAALERYRGHLLNWYETQQLEPLLPRYVSSVDSGNLAGALLVLRKACSEVATTPVLRREQWDGLGDVVELILEDIARLDAATAAIDLRGFREAVDQLHAQILEARDHPIQWWPTLQRYFDGSRTSLHRQLTTALEQGAQGVDLSILRDLRTWLDRLQLQFSHLRQDAEEMLPWLRHADSLPAVLSLPAPDVRLDAIPDACERAVQTLDQLDERGDDHQALRSALQAARAASRRRIEDLGKLAVRAHDELEGMDFSLFYDSERRLLHIGYDVSADRMDPNYYDLLASEARLASYVAIIKGDVPQEHWYALGRPITRVRRRVALLSWSATMFEYLMPHLMMRSQERTLLYQSALAAIDRQVGYARGRGVPWGISESGFYGYDADENYQYRAFGVPGLGFQRGLSDDLVITPYASFLALSLRPQAVLDNLRDLRTLGMVGSYGLYEAIDFTEGRVARGRRGAIVRSYMAHHQGMCLVAIDNFLHGDPMVRRFHRNSLVQTGEMLLNEQVPVHVAAERPLTDVAVPVESVPTPASLPTWSPPVGSASPGVTVLSNGRLTTILTSDGGGGISCGDLAVTRWSAGTTSAAGIWLHVKDIEDDTMWSAGRAPCGSWPTAAYVTFQPHRADFVRHDHGVSLHLEVAVAPADDVEVRRVTVTNETDRTRRLSLTSSAEPVLDVMAEVGRHPAFSKLFLESEIQLDGRRVLFRRRPRSPTDRTVLVAHQLVTEGDAVRGSGAETDRSRFVGRLRQWCAPAMVSDSGRRLEGTHGQVLDPVMAVQALAVIPPHVTVQLGFVTAVAPSRRDVLALAKKYESMHAIEWVFQDAAVDSMDRLQKAGLDPASLAAAMDLLAGLMFPHPGLRAPSEWRTETLASQPRLWRYGVSGDFPILVVRVFDGDGPLLSEVLAAHRYWRSSGVAVEVVLLNEGGSGYRDETGERIRRVVTEGGSDMLLGQRGGLFLVPGARVPERERRLLLTAANVVLDTRADGLEEPLRRRHKPLPELPPMPVTLPWVSYPKSPPTSETLRFDNGIGGFSADGTEYVMRVGAETRTPAPWCNVLANEDFGSIVSESSLGYTWGLNSGEHRITPWFNDPVLDVSGEALYLRDEETARVWSATPQPASGDCPFTVRHGAGYTEYAHECHGIRHRLRVFVPSGQAAKVARLRLENRTSRPRRLTLTYYAEWVLGADRERTRAHVVPEYAQDHGCLLARCAWNPEFADRVAFLSAEREVHAFTCDRTEFLGPDGDRVAPAGLHRWGLSGETRPGSEPCAALQVHVGLDAGETVETHFVLGEGDTRAQALELVAALRGADAVERAWVAVRAHWDDRLGRVRVQTPDPGLDLMLNRWLLYESLSARLLGRTGFYQSSGAFGFRDQLQDVMAYLHTAPELARRHILEAAAHQFEDGDVLHWWHPPGGKGVRTRCSDDLLWLPFVTAHYVRSTADDSILSAEVPFLSAEPLQPAERVRYGEFEQGARASLLEHCRRAMTRGFTAGDNGLPLIGDGDWNDGMNRIGADGRGESVWLAWFTFAAVTSFAELLPDPERAEWLRRAAELRDAIEESAWDGAWYRRAFHDDGSTVGSAGSVECRIDSISQSWAALSGAARDDRARAALRSAREHLVREADALVLLLTPPFNRTRHDPGYIRGYPPGIRENGGQYTHAAAWLGWAFARIGDGDEATRILRILNPVYHAASRADIERYRVEPYVLAGDVYGAAPHIGRGGWTWYTGAASWVWRLGIEAILGLRLEDGGLVIDPCLPAEWDGYGARLRYEGGELDITVDNPDHVSRGVASVRVDGQLQTSNAVVRAAGRHQVLVTLRKPRHQGATGSHGDD